VLVNTAHCAYSQEPLALLWGTRLCQADYCNCKCLSIGATYTGFRNLGMFWFSSTHTSGWQVPLLCLPSQQAAHLCGC
jgi:hypothetical protein